MDDNGLPDKRPYYILQLSARDIGVYQGKTTRMDSPDISGNTL